MSLVVNTNLNSAMIQGNLAKASSDMSTYMERLSTGLRINSASDDAAGLALSEKLRSHISASDVAKNNAQTGMNMLDVAEGDLAEMHDLLQRMRDLSVQSANSVYSTTERTAIDNEFQEYLSEIDRISSTSSFSEIKLLDGTAGTVNLQIGTSNSANDRLDISSAFAVLSSTTLALNGDDIDTVAEAQTAMTTIDTAIDTISTRRSSIGGFSNRLKSTIERLDVRKQNLQSSYSIIRDADIAAETANLTKTQILQQASATLLQQANQAPSLALSLL